MIPSALSTLSSIAIRTDPNRKEWLAGSLAIIVCFDEQGRVVGKGGANVYRPFDTSLEMICQWFGLSEKKPYPPGTIPYP